MLQEIERNGERVHIQTIHIVDKQTVVDTLIHFQTHLHRHKLGATLLYLLGRVAHEEHEGDAMHRVLHRSVVDKRDSDIVFLARHLDFESRVILPVYDIQQPHLILLRVTPSVEVHLLHALLLRDDILDVLVVAAVYKSLAVSEKLQFFRHFLMTSQEVLVVSLAYVSKDSDGRLYDVAQRRHLTRLRDARLEYSHVVGTLHLPHRERHADLRIVAFRRRHHLAVGRQKLHQPVLHDGLAVATRDSHHRDAESIAMSGSDKLQSLHHILHIPHIHVVPPLDLRPQPLTCPAGQHKHRNTLMVQFLHILAARITFGWDSEEDRADGSYESATVGEQIVDIPLTVGHLEIFRFDDFSYYFRFHLNGDMLF